jgi:outer membrane protein OmpA-like peptidoglycan-associated protein
VKKYFQSGTILLLILWLIGTLIYLPYMEPKLNDAAKALLADPEHAGLFANVRVKFSGQEAKLTGWVATAEEKTKATAIIANDLRLQGWFTGAINPVTAVHNKELGIDPKYRPRPWLIVAVYGGNQRIDGVLNTPDQRLQLLTTIAGKLPPPTLPLNNQVMIDEIALPAPDWDATIAALPDLTATAPDQAAVAVSPCDGHWSTLPATAGNAEIATALKATSVKDNEISNALAKLRAWKPPTPEELQQQATKKAAEEAAKAKALQPPIAPNANPPYVGATGAEGSLKLFGILPTAADRDAAINVATKAFPTYQVDGAAIQLDPSRVLPQGKIPIFPSPPADAKPFVCLSAYDGTHKLYPAEIFNSEIARDFPAITFAKDEIAAALNDFRLRLTAAGTLPHDEPCLALLTDGKTLTLSGEIADPAAKEAIVTAVKAANPGFDLADQLAVTALVAAVPKLQPTLDSIPKLTPATPAAATATPGQPWRTGVVQSIHFPAGNDRSKDVERAIEQMRQVLAALPAAKFEVVGHTDDTGTAAANTKLSLERAERFVAQTTAAGLPAAAITARGAGPAEPIEPNKTAAGKALNRRVDVLLK